MDRFFLPPRCRIWSKDGWHLYFDPYNFAWARVNDSGRLLLEIFRKYMTVAQATSVVASQFNLPPAKAEEGILKFANGLVSSGLLHKNIYKERARIEFPALDFPQDVYVHLTNKCNLKCPYCYNKTDRETKIKLEKVGLVAPTMSTEEFKDLIHRMVTYGVYRILFTGGEPLLRADALELLAYARQCSDRRVQEGGSAVVLEMLTNGTRIVNDVTATRMCELLDNVTISLDGHEQHMHEEQRGERTFEPTVRGIRRLVAKKKELGRQKPYVCMVPALTAKNITFMKEIFEFSLDDLQADRLAPIIFQAGDHQEISITQIPELGVYLEAQSRTNEYLKARRARLGLAATKNGAVGPRRHCGVGHGEISIDPGGFVYPCQSLHFDEFICGNVRETDIKEIFHESPVMKRTRGTTVDTLKVCSHCDLKNLCNGGCRATAYNVYREFDHHNEIYCKMLETVAVSKLWAGAENQVFGVNGQRMARK